MDWMFGNSFDSKKWRGVSVVLLFLLGCLSVLFSIYRDEVTVHGRLLLSSHKSLFPLNFEDVVGTILVSLGLLIAASGGIGGGGILVPLFILVFGFGPKHAVALSNFCILATSITNMVINLPKRHPFADRPLVDWDLILVMEPLTMGGAICGALTGKLMPDWILVCSLVILLAFTTWTTLEKGFSQYRNETKSFMAEVQQQNRDQTENEPLLSDQRDTEKLSDDFGASSVPPNQELSSILEQERKTPWDKVSSILSLVLVVTVLNLLKGGGGNFPSPIGIECGSFWYWAVTAAVFVWILYIALHMRADLIERWKQKKRVNYKYLEGDVEWDPISTIKYPCICIFAGFFAGMFGIGGGIVKGPLMLWMGIHPLVASATVAVMIMLTSVAACAMYIAFGVLQWDYGIYFAVVGFISTTVGQFGVAYLVKKYKRNSLISLSIGSVVAISTVLMSIQGIFSLIDANNGTAQENNALCSSN